MLAFIELVRTSRPLTRAEVWFVRLPLSVFTGWITVAPIANIAFALRSSGVRDLGLAETTWAWAALMFAAATLIGVAMTRFSEGNAWYAGTVVWALIGIVVANVVREPNLTVAIAAGAAGLVALSPLAGTTMTRLTPAAK
ncbi:hypothetical protein [Deinococcus humi]|uniref:Uncharacterized protein n=1 Tax=Deinococcus humi TaxID=662880 RepID=A0A7W8JV17_9DEIO|nr:hypothetical protein [Deinococcus humi]MBB5363475.1 hypothetical protein [Deinococcus humi]GGO30634.1 hypothetical protein GCM10008949_25690 [Deinococcus humi]